MNSQKFRCALWLSHKVAHPLSFWGLVLFMSQLMGMQEVMAMVELNIPAKICDVTQYGVNGRRQLIHHHTAKIQQAIDDCAAAGGGTVLFPPGNYLSEPLFLKSRIRLHLMKGATLVASTVESSYRPPASKQEAQAENGWLPFISMADVHDVQITGQGAIDGQGAVWWERWRSQVRQQPAKRGATNRPRLIYISRSHHVQIDGVSISNSPSFHVVMRDSEHIDVHHTRITSPAFAPHTDAIDPINSRHVSITHNVIDTNDDHVAIKADKWDPLHPDASTHDIYIAHNTLLGGRGISIGSETSGGVSHVRVEHNHFENSMYGLRIKTPRGKGGKVTDITYKDTTMLNVGVPLVFSGYYKSAPDDAAELAALLSQGGFEVGDQIYPPDNDPAVTFHSIQTPQLSRIHIINLRSTGRSQAAGYFVGVPESPIQDFQMDNVHIEADKGLLVRHAQVQVRQLQIQVRSADKWLLQQNGQVVAK